MKTRYILSALVLLSATTIYAQMPAQPAFTQYAYKQSDLMQKAYDNRDAETGRKLVEDFAAKYASLSKNDQAYFRGNIINAYYNLSCTYALISNKPKALQYLDSAVTKGYTNYKHLLEDSDFASIRNDAQFKTIANGMRAIGDYTYILKHAGKYNTAQQRNIPAFTYQNANAPELVALRKRFKLDSIAGTGDDAAKAKNLLHWVHNTVNHDGQHESGIKLINADEIVNVATAKKIGVSCGELASVLNDCYLAMGYKCRKVYCFPKDSLKTDFDSHVINIVYLPSINKWVWMDPTNNAYVTDENGQMLGIREVRDRLVNNQPLAINTDANWNNRQKTTKEQYLDNYMTKNLYMVYSPLRSEYDYQTPGKNKEIAYVNLLPLDYFKQTPEVSTGLRKATNTTVVWYLTNNPDTFWAVDAKK